MGFGRKAKRESQKIQQEQFLSQFLTQQEIARQQGLAAAADQQALAAARQEELLQTQPVDNKLKRLSSILTTPQGLLTEGNIARGRLLGA
jgi:hypothetical protein